MCITFDKKGLGNMLGEIFFINSSGHPVWYVPTWGHPKGVNFDHLKKAGNG
jgi:hypothetical protein